MKGFEMNEIELIFDKLYSYFNVATITELAQKLDMTQPAVTNWIRRNSISAIKKRCRELGIYNDIFGMQKEDKNMNNIVINDILLEQAKEKASQYGLNINSYLEFLIVQDLK